ncbi:MAG: sigma-70 family RNA polymerase sigma factor [Candidatus Dormibacter sp.]
MTEDGGDSRAFEALYTGLFPLVVRTVYLVILDRDIAQEITHEAFLRLWQHRDRLGEHANEKAWLMRVAINLALDHRRSLLTALRHRQPEAPMPDPATAAIDHLEREAMRRALQRLSRRDRAVLALRFEQGLSFPEIGHIVGRPEPTVKTWVHRALARLQREIGSRPAPAMEKSS